MFSLKRIIKSSKRMSGHFSMIWSMMMMMIMMMMINCFCGMIDRQKALSLIFSRDHSQKSSLWRISDTPWRRFEFAQNLSWSFVEWICAIVITNTPRRHWNFWIFLLWVKDIAPRSLKQLQESVFLIIHNKLCTSNYK